MGRVAGWQKAGAELAEQQERNEEAEILEPEPDHVVLVTAGHRHPAELDPDLRPRLGQQPEHDRETERKRWNEEGKPVAPAMKRGPEGGEGHTGAVAVNVKGGRQPGEHAREQEGLPTLSLDRREEDGKDDQYDREAEQRGALRKHAGDERGEPLVVLCPERGVFARQVGENREALGLEVTEEVDEAEAAAQREDEGSERRDRPAPGEPHPRQVHDGREGEGE